VKPNINSVEGSSTTEYSNKRHPVDGALLGVLVVHCGHFFGALPIKKTETGTAYMWELLITTTHLEQSL
jgi:hypothetical protein